eukprot:COSAG02_NODE_4825_length_4935_cov_19.885029_3_plen_71_part_00
MPMTNMCALGSIEQQLNTQDYVPPWRRYEYWHARRASSNFMTTIFVLLPNDNHHPGALGCMEQTTTNLVR